MESFDAPTELARARELAAAACARLGEMRLSSALRVEFHARFTRRLGDARHSPPLIRLSLPLWPRTSPEERRSTVLHELCHVVAQRRHGPRVQPHGPEWRELMGIVGETPTPRHGVDRSGLARSQRRFAFACACPGKSHRVSALRVGRMRRGWTYRCVACGETLKPVRSPSLDT